MNRQQGKDDGAKLKARMKVRHYIERYKELSERVEYIDNKIINVHSNSYDYMPTHNNAKPQKNINDYIHMKEECKAEMQEIRDNVERVENIKYRNVLFYRYIECLNVYDIAELMDYSIGTVRRYILDAVDQLVEILGIA